MWQDIWTDLAAPLAVFTRIKHSRILGILHALNSFSPKACFSLFPAWCVNFFQNLILVTAIKVSAFWVQPFPCYGCLNIFIKMIKLLLMTCNRAIGCWSNGMTWQVLYTEYLVRPFFPHIMPPDQFTNTKSKSRCTNSVQTKPAI